MSIFQPDAEDRGSRELPYSCLISAVTQREERSAMCEAEPTYSCQNGLSRLCSHTLIFLTSKPAVTYSIVLSLSS